MKARDREKGLSAERLRELFFYYPETGVFTRKVTRCNAAKAGSAAGSISLDDGYVRIGIDGNKYLAHRLAWLYVKGTWPEDIIDHRDLDRSNNIFSNLRQADNVGNRCNSRVMKNNALGIKCVQLHETGKYRARIFCDGKFKSLGLHDTPELASDAYAKASREMFGDFARAA